MKLLLDMNLSPSWVGFLEEQGFEAPHWHTRGEPTATDATLMAWARSRGFVVITHDLDFSAILAATEAGWTERAPDQDSRCVARHVGGGCGPGAP